MNTNGLLSPCTDGAGGATAGLNVFMSPPAHEASRSWQALGPGEVLGFPPWGLQPIPFEDAVPHEQKLHR